MLNISEKIYHLLNKFGPLLILVIIFILLSNLFLLILYSFSFFIQLEIDVSILMTSIFIIISLINIFLMIKLFLLKKWAFYAYVVISFFVFLLNLLSGQNLFQAMWYLFPLFLLTLFYLPKRKNFK